MEPKEELVIYVGILMYLMHVMQLIWSANDDSFTVENNEVDDICKINAQVMYASICLPTHVTNLQLEFNNDLKHGVLIFVLWKFDDEHWKHNFRMMKHTLFDIINQLCPLMQK